MCWLSNQNVCSHDTSDSYSSDVRSGYCILSSRSTQLDSSYMWDLRQLPAVQRPRRADLLGITA